jgi:hypothetical protein
MHHGGPYPRPIILDLLQSVFRPLSCALLPHCYDKVSDEYLPEELRAKTQLPDVAPGGWHWTTKIFKKSCLCPQQKKN